MTNGLSLFAFLFPVAFCLITPSLLAPSLLEYRGDGRLFWMPPPHHTAFVSCDVLLADAGNQATQAHSFPTTSYAHIRNLEPSSCFSVRVRLVDNRNTSTSWSEELDFCTAASNVSSAVWLYGHPLMRAVIEAENVQYGVLHLSGVGCFAAYFNGIQISEEMTPSWSRYQYRVLYNTFKLDKTGVIALELGTCHYGSNWYGGTPLRASLWSKLVLHFTNGTIAVHPLRWKVSNAGIIVDSSIYGGETVNASRAQELSGWMLPSFSDKFWPLALKDPSPPKGILIQQAFLGEHILDRRSPISFCQTENGTVFDFGENLAGVCELHISSSGSGAAWKVECLVYYRL